MQRFLLAAGLLCGATLLAGCALPAAVNVSWCRATDVRGKSEACASADVPTPWGKP